MDNKVKQKQTNMEQVKDVAKMFLHMDVGKTKFSPIIVKHPFADSGITMVRAENGDYEMVNLLKKEELLKWRKYVEQCIESADRAFQLHMMITKPYAMVFLYHISEYLSDKDYADILSNSWVMTENPNLDPNFSKKKLLALFQRADPCMLMDENEYAKFKNLNDTVTIYRGVTSYNAKNVKALSWTLEEKVAEWFAHRYGEEGTMYKAQISKEYKNGEYVFKSHDYRHSIATTFYEEGVPIQSIRDYLGHDYEEMTLQYVDYMPKKVEKANEDFFQKR